MAPPVNKFASTTNSQFRREFGGTATTRGSTVVIASTVLPDNGTAHVLYRVVSCDRSTGVSGLWYRSAVVNMSAGIADARSDSNIDVFDTDVPPGHDARVRTSGADALVEITVTSAGGDVDWLAFVDVQILERER